MFELTLCVSVDRLGRDCRGAIAPDAPIPLCMSHMRTAYVYYADYLQAMPDPTCEDREAAARMPLRKSWPRRDREQSVVYYVTMGYHVKIGSTRDFAVRMSQLQPDEILATEPGDMTLERERHQQFERFRAKGREYFHPTPELMAHIEAIRAAPAVEEEPLAPLPSPGFVRGARCPNCDLICLYRAQVGGDAHCDNCDTTVPAANLGAAA